MYIETCKHCQEGVPLYKNHIAGISVKHDIDSLYLSVEISTLGGVDIPIRHCLNCGRTFKEVIDSRNN